mmetsp:Transcript_84242/g.225187  ORF Transcript_84242/g.225187 Transcript_84242/m.225187 type:complete len:156 (+) Transcript_84242:61-528(+)
MQTLRRNNSASSKRSATSHSSSTSSAIFFEFQRKQRSSLRSSSAVDDDIDVEFNEKKAQSQIENLMGNKFTILSIAVLLAITMICSLIPELRLPACAAQSLGIAVASLRWDESSTFPEAVNYREMIRRYSCHVIVVFVPLAMGAGLVAISVLASK